MRFFKAFIVFFSVFVVACNKDKKAHGEIVYNITYPHSSVSGFILALLPDEMTLIFSGTKMMTTIERGRLFSTQIITDESDKSIEMRLLLGKEQLIYTILTPEDVKKLKATQPDYTIENTNDTDSLVHLFAKRYAVSCASDTIENEDAWFTEELTPQNAYWFTSYSEITGVPLNFDFERYGVFMRVEAISFEEREIKAKEFERDPRLTFVTFDEYEEKAQEIFDSLMN